MMPSPPWPNSYVRDLHASVSTPHAVLASLVRRAVDGDLDQVQRIVEGYDNEVYRVRTSEGQDVVVRIRRFGGNHDSARIEADAITQARAIGVPGPEVLLLDTVSLDGRDFPVMVQRAVPGLPLSDVYDGLTTRQRRAVLFEVGELIARLNRVPARADWTTNTRAQVAKRRAERELIVAAGFTNVEFSQMINALESYIDDFPCPQPVLCHGDLGPKHIYVDSNAKVVGVIDFGDAHPGSPVHDLAVLRVRGPDLDLGPVLSGYGAPATPRFAEQLDLHTLLMALGSLAIGVDESDDACVARLSKVVRSLLNSGLGQASATDDPRAAHPVVGRAAVADEQ